MSRPRFICLDPRKRKRAAVEAVIGPVGEIAFLKAVPMRLGGYPETEAVAEAALAAAIRPKKGWMGRAAKRKLYALQYNGARRFFERQTGVIAACWNGLNGSRYVFMQGAQDAGARRLFFELAPLPGRITVDPCGVNFRNALPRTVAPFLDWAEKAGVPADGWRSVGGEINQRKGGGALERSEELPALAEPFIFVPLQVPNDSQLRLFGGAYKTVPALIDAVIGAAEHLPDGWHVRIKEHPSAKISFAERIRAATGRRVYLDNATDTFELVQKSRAVLTVNSSVGLEAMFYDKPVIAAGQCFWSLPGVALEAPEPSDLERIFAAPQDLSFDAESRNAFLSYLVERYYIRLDWLADDRAEMPGSEVPKVLAKISEARPLLP